MKKLVIGFDGEPHGTLCVVNGKFHAEGPRPEACLHHAQSAMMEMLHRDPSLNDTMEPEHVLDHLAANLRGRAHAHWEGEAAKPDKKGTRIPEPRVVKALETLPVPNAIALAARLTGVSNIRTRAQAIAAYTKAWNEESHPRDDAGRFVSAGEIRAAKRDPKKADALRKTVSDPEQRKKLESAIASAVVPGEKQGRSSDASAHEFHFEEGRHFANLLRGGLVNVIKNAASTDRSERVALVKAWRARARNIVATHWSEAIDKANAQLAADYPVPSGENPFAWRDKHFHPVQNAMLSARDKILAALDEWARDALSASDEVASGDDVNAHRELFDARYEAVTNLYQHAQDEVWNAVEQVRDVLGGKEKGHKLGRYFKAFDPSEPRDESGKWTGGGNALDGSKPVDTMPVKGTGTVSEGKKVAKALSVSTIKKRLSNNRWLTAAQVCDDLRQCGPLAFAGGEDEYKGFQYSTKKKQYQMVYSALLKSRSEGVDSVLGDDTGKETRVFKLLSGKAE